MLKIAILVGLTYSEQRTISSCLRCIHGRCDRTHNICGSIWIWWNVGQLEWALSGICKYHRCDHVIVLP